MALHRTLFRSSRMTKLSTAWVLLLLFTLVAPNVALAQGTDAQRRAAIEEAVDQAGGFGKVLSVKPYQQADGQPGFRIRILIDGKVRTFDIPAGEG